VAGTIAALAGNDIGVAGAGKFRLHITRALDDNGSGWESDVRNAVSQCVDAGADIINMSLGGTSLGQGLYNYYKEIVEEKGIMIVAAAGNAASKKAHFPASHPSVISVAAIYSWEMYWPQSNYGEQIELAAPGVHVLSTTVSSSAVVTKDFAYRAFDIEDSPNYAATGPLVYCGDGSYKCTDAAGGGICLMVKDKKKLKDMLKNCEAGGGTGAVFFALEQIDWKKGKPKFPAVHVPRNTGIELVMEKLGVNVTVGDMDGDDKEYTYSYFSGTSMASPHVAAAAGLAWSYHKAECSNQQIRYALAASALDLDPKKQPGCDERHGYGLVQARDAYEWLLLNNCTTWNVTNELKGGCHVLEE
jgi:subtilisin family serine protease